MHVHRSSKSTSFFVDVVPWRGFPCGSVEPSFIRFGWKTIFFFIYISLLAGIFKSMCHCQIFFKIHSIILYVPVRYPRGHLNSLIEIENICVSIISTFFIVNVIDEWLLSQAVLDVKYFLIYLFVRLLATVYIIYMY